MPDKDDKAREKGHHDRKKWEESRPNPLRETIHSSYRPPSGSEKPYKEGWDEAKQDKKK